jgi:hypothetical protein
LSLVGKMKGFHGHGDALHRPAPRKPAPMVILLICMYLN